MKISFIVVGKTAQSYLVESVADYTARIRRYIPFDMEVIPELKNTRNLTTEQQKEREGELILRSLQPGDYVVQKKQSIPRRLVFIVGGPYGFSPAVYDRCNEKLSLSKMTFSHQMIRLFFTEQLYRAMTILNNEPYHHE